MRRLLRYVLRDMPIDMFACILFGGLAAAIMLAELANR